MNDCKMHKASVDNCTITHFTLHNTPHDKVKYHNTRVETFIIKNTTFNDTVFAKCILYDISLQNSNFQMPSLSPHETKIHNILDKCSQSYKRLPNVLENIVYELVDEEKECFNIITHELKKVKEYTLENEFIIFVQHSTDNSYIPYGYTKEYIFAGYNDQTSLFMTCKECVLMVPFLFETLDQIHDDIYYKVQITSPCLIPIEQIHVLMRSHHKYWIAKRSIELDHVASLLSIAINSKNYNIYSKPISLVSSDHCQSKSNQTKYDLYPLINT
jgi:hypothetical protein